MKRKYLKRTILFIGVLLVLLSILYFMPKPLIKDSDDISLQRISYESTKTQNTEDFPDSAKQELLTYLKTCKVHRTLYSPAPSSSADYLYIRLHNGTRPIDIHFFQADCYVLIDGHPFVYHFTNADEVQQEIFDILGISQVSEWLSVRTKGSINDERYSQCHQ